MYRPIWYFSNTLDNGLKQGISSFGNPAVWWLGIGAVAYMAALVITIPLKERKYFGVNKYYFAGIYALIFAVCCVAAYSAGSSNEKLERLFPCMIFYSIVMVGTLLLTLTYDESIKQKSNRVALFLLIGYLAELMPWVLVVRTTYIYHYFPCVPFTTLMLGYTIKTIYEDVKEHNRKKVIVSAFVYAGVAVVLFAMFYPVLSGHPCNYDYAVNWLKWFKSWVLL
jgi:dolichyl-phosphate-mannose--protein O-mannosyl transferase